MNNLIPTKVRLSEKYDLKGSIYKRKASEEELKRDLPTLKDNDFKSVHRNGLRLEPFFYDQLMQTIEDDVRVSFLQFKLKINQSKLLFVLPFFVLSNDRNAKSVDQLT